MGKLSPSETKRLLEYIKHNPEDTYKDFLGKCKSISISDAYYYMRRREIHGTTNPPRTPRGPRGPRGSKSLYMKVWSYPSDKVNPPTKDVLNNFIETLNGTRRAHFELIELKDPAVVEVREITR